MAETNDELKTRLQLLDEIEKKRAKMEAAEKNSALNEDLKIRYLQKQKKLTDELINQLKEHNKVRLDGLSSAETTLSTLSGLYTNLYGNLQKLEQKRIADSVKADDITNAQLAAFNEMASINQKLAQLDREDIAQREELRQQYEEQKSLLGDLSNGGRAILDNLEQQNSLANSFANTTKKQKEFTEKHLGVLNGVKDTIGGILETASVLTSTMGGMLGAGLLGANMGMKKLLSTSRTLGASMFSTANITTSVFSLAFDDAAGVAKSLSSELGGMNEASAELQYNANVISKNFNISSDESGKLLGNLLRANGGSEEMAMNTLQGAENLAIANGIPLDDLMSDVAGSGEAFALYGKDGGKNILEAAVAAKKLGVNMSTLTNITDNLLDFETSMTKELELGVMLGKNINLNAARQAAYQGNIGTAVKETLNQLGGIEEFNRMDYYQKKQTADLLGISVEELSKMANNADKLNEKGEIQQTTWEGISQSLKAFGEQGLAGVDTIASMAIVSGQMGMSWSGIGDKVKQFGSWAADGLKNLIGMGGVTEKLGANLTENVLDKGTESLASQATGTATETLTDNLGSKVGDSLDNIEAPEVQSGPSMGDKLKDLAGGLTEMGTGKVLFGALNLIPTGLGFVAILPGIPGMFAVGALGTKAGTGLMNLAIGLEFMGNTKVLFGALNLIPTGLGFALMTLGIIGMAGVALLGTPAGAGLIALGIGLSVMSGGLLGAAVLAVAGLGFAVMTLGIPGMLGVALLGVPASIGLIALGIGLNIFGAAAMNPLVWAGVGLLAVLGLSLVVFGAGIMVVAMGIERMITAISSVGPIIAELGTSLSGMVGLAGSILLFAGSLAVLGYSLIALALSSMVAAPGLLIFSMLASGLSVLSVAITNIMSSISGVSNVVGQLTPLTTMITPIFALAGAITALGLALAFLGTTGFVGLAVLAGVAALAEPIAMIAGILGIGGEGTGGETGAVEKGSLSEYETTMLQKMDILIAEVSKNRDVYMDKEKVTNIVMAQSERRAQNVFGLGVA